MNSLNYFNSIAKDWNNIRVDYFKDELRDIAINSVDLKNKVVADLGAGTGFISLKVAESADIVFSIDASKNMLRELNKSAQNLGLKNIYPITGDLENLPLFDNSVDVVFINMALHNVVNPDKAIKEMRRILKEGGRVIITDVEEHDGTWATDEMNDVWLGFNHNDLTKWYEEAEFKDIAIKDTGLVAKGVSSRGDVIEPKIFMAIGTK